VIETPENWKVVADLPGVSKGDIKVHREAHKEGWVLTIEAEKKSDVPSKEDEQKWQQWQWHVWERSHNKSYQRVIPMPASCDMDNVKTQFENSILTLNFAKKESVARKAIAI
jgi:HSP20 family molecular chaperone IbpA